MVPAGDSAPSKEWGADPMPAGKDEWGAASVNGANWGAEPTGTTTDWGASAADAPVGWD